MATPISVAHVVARRILIAGALLLVVAGACPIRAETPFTAPAPLGGAQVTGEITDMFGASMQLTLRTGQPMLVDLSAALAQHLVPPLFAGEYVQVQGSMSGSGMIAVAVARAKSAPAVWPPDIP